MQKAKIRGGGKGEKREGRKNNGETTTRKQKKKLMKFRIWLYVFLPGGCGGDKGSEEVRALRCEGGMEAMGGRFELAEAV